MNRRGFLSSLIAGGLSAAIDPDRLLWEPGKKLISIPKASDHPADEFVAAWVRYTKERERILNAIQDVIRAQPYHQLYITTNRSSSQLAAWPDEARRSAAQLPATALYLQR